MEATLVNENGRLRAVWKPVQTTSRKQKHNTATHANSNNNINSTHASQFQTPKNASHYKNAHQSSAFDTPASSMATSNAERLYQPPRLPNGEILSNYSNSGVKSSNRKASYSTPQRLTEYITNFEPASSSSKPPPANIFQQNANSNSNRSNLSKSSTASSASDRLMNSQTASSAAKLGARGRVNSAINRQTSRENLKVNTLIENPLNQRRMHNNNNSTRYSNFEGHHRSETNVTASDMGITDPGPSISKIVMPQNNNFEGIHASENDNDNNNEEDYDNIPAINKTESAILSDEVLPDALVTGAAIADEDVQSGYSNNSNVHNADLNIVKGNMQAYVDASEDDMFLKAQQDDEKAALEITVCQINRCHE